MSRCFVDNKLGGAFAAKLSLWLFYNIEVFKGSHQQYRQHWESTGPHRVQEQRNNIPHCMSLQCPTQWGPPPFGSSVTFCLPLLTAPNPRGIIAVVPLHKWEQYKNDLYHALPKREGTLKAVLHFWKGQQCCLSFWRRRSYRQQQFNVVK